MLRALLLASLFTLATQAQVSAQAETRRVVLVAIDPELTRAVHASLEPWGVEIVSAEGEAPSSMPLAADRGREISAAQHADAVVWISASADGPALWVYDTSTERALARALPQAPPFDEPTAAAVALTVKTLLRHSMVAPAGERAVEPAPPPVRIVELEIGAGIGAFASSPADVEPRVSLAASLWPRELTSVVGFSLTARAGPGVGFRSRDVSGRWTSTLLAVGLRLRGDLGLVDLGVGIEAGIAITTLDAQLRGSRETHLVRAAFGGAAWAEIAVQPDPVLRIALRAGTTAALPYERYVQRGEIVLDVSPFGFLAELLASLALS